MDCSGDSLDEMTAIASGLFPYHPTADMATKVTYGITMESENESNFPETQYSLVFLRLTYKFMSL